VISEANKYGVKLILSLVNNWNDFGGKKKYVQWARERGQNVKIEDDFFINPLVKQYYKNNVKVSSYIILYGLLMILYITQVW